MLLMLVASLLLWAKYRSPSSSRSLLVGPSPELALGGSASAGKGVASGVLPDLPVDLVAPVSRGDGDGVAAGGEADLHSGLRSLFQTPLVLDDAVGVRDGLLSVVPAVSPRVVLLDLEQLRVAATSVAKSRGQTSEERSDELV